MLRTKMSENSEIAQLKAMSPDQEGPKASQVLAGTARDFWPYKKASWKSPESSSIGGFPRLKSQDFWS